MDSPKGEGELPISWSFCISSTLQRPRVFDLGASHWEPQRGTYASAQLGRLAGLHERMGCASQRRDRWIFIFLATCPSSNGNRPMSTSDDLCLVPISCPGEPPLKTNRQAHIGSVAAGEKKTRHGNVLYECFIF